DEGAARERLHGDRSIRGDERARGLRIIRAERGRDSDAALREPSALMKLQEVQLESREGVDEQVAVELEPLERRVEEAMALSLGGVSLRPCRERPAPAELGERQRERDALDIEHTDAVKRALIAGGTQAVRRPAEAAPGVDAHRYAARDLHCARYTLG